MALKFFITLLLVTMTIAVQSQIYYRNPTYKQNQKESLSKYEFGYKVEDEHTKDMKGQHESREGDLVKGFYELIDSDGFKRRVEYIADDHHGFRAFVKRIKTDIVVPIPESKFSKNTDLNQYKQHYRNGNDETIYSTVLVQNNLVAPTVVQKKLTKLPLKSFGKGFNQNENNEILNGSSHVTFHDSVTSYHY